MVRWFSIIKNCAMSATLLLRLVKTLPEKVCYLQTENILETIVPPP